MQMDSLDAEVATNKSRPLSVEEIVSEFSEQPAEVITDGDDENEHEESDEQIAHPSRNEVGEAIETLNRLSLFTEDSGFAPLISNLTRIINRGRTNKTWQSSINNFFQQQ